MPGHRGSFHPFNAAAANGVSNALDLWGVNGFSVTIKTTGTGTATLTAEVCDSNHSEISGDPARANPGSNANFVTSAAINTLLTKPADGSAGSIRVEVSDFRGRWLRFRLASSSGTYTCDVQVTAKGNG